MFYILVLKKPDRSKSTKIEKVPLVHNELYSSNGSRSEPMRLIDGFIDKKIERMNSQI